LQPLFKQGNHRLRPNGGVVATGGFWSPQIRAPGGAGLEVIGVERVEAAGREAELFRGLAGRYGVLPKGRQDMADEGGGVAMDELLMLFKGRRIRAKTGCATSLFVGHRYARPPQRLVAQPGTFLF
jgi:hypothetical protein